MEITSIFDQNQIIPSRYTCDREDINPPLDIREIPEGTKSLVLIIDDPDAPSGVWSHWIVFNIDLKEIKVDDGELDGKISDNTYRIEEDSVPEGSIQGLNSFSKQSYGGPCPSHGIHHYRFKVYALDDVLDLDESAENETIKTAMDPHILDWAELVGIYQR